jgi:hypothetical protein
LPASALLAQSWWQWVATSVIAGLALVALEVRIGASALAGCLLVSHCVPTIAVAGLARLGNVSELTRPDYGMSCLMVGAVAALAWQTRSGLIALALVISLAVDPLFNSPVTTAEHLIAALLGALVSAWVCLSPRGVEPGRRELLASRIPAAQRGH